MGERNDTYSKLKRQFREDAEQYWRAISDVGWAPDYPGKRARALANAALRLHLFEQGRRSSRRRAVHQ